MRPLASVIVSTAAGGCVEEKKTWQKPATVEQGAAEKPQNAIKLGQEHVSTLCAIKACSRRSGGLTPPPTVVSVFLLVLLVVVTSNYSPHQRQTIVQDRCAP